MWYFLVFWLFSGNHEVEMETVSARYSKDMECDVSLCYCTAVESDEWFLKCCYPYEQVQSLEIEISNNAEFSDNDKENKVCVVGGDGG